MAFTKKQKVDMTALYEKWLTESEAMFVLDYKSLTMKDIDMFRAKAREAGSEIHLVKNTLFTRAGKEGVSRESACALIAALLEEYAAGRSPSDRELSEELLNRYGLRLARRTVNLYRSKLARPAERNRV